MRHAEETAGALDKDAMAVIFSFLNPVETMCLRRVCTTWRDAAKETLVPLSDMAVNSVRSYNAIRVMSTAVPNLQQLLICKLEEGHKYSDGEDPDETRAFFTANYISHDIDIISRFSKLHTLEIDSATLNGRFPALFNFPLLQKLSIRSCFLQWDLRMLEGLPSLKELNCSFSHNLEGHLSSLRVLKHTLEVVEIDYCGFIEGNLTDLADFPSLTVLSLSRIKKLSGNISSLAGLKSPLESVTIVQCSDFEGDLKDLRVLKDTLKKVTITDCSNIRGSFTDLADFPRLKKLDLSHTIVTGDIRDIREHDFPALESLSLPPTVQGGRWFEFQLISDVPSFMRAIHLLLQRSPAMFKEYSISRAFDWSLSADSPDRYDWHLLDTGGPTPPFCLEIFQAGSRLGWSWCTFRGGGGHSCEINWLDLEPKSGSSDFEAYTETLQRIEGSIDFYLYRGHHQPPTEAEFRRLCDSSS